MNTARKDSEKRAVRIDSKTIILTDSKLPDEQIRKNFIEKWLKQG